ncbi:hypothetical protein [Halorubrum halodurans]|uniref:Uncharacterized protein n=1 Tax=Halorubrum halodurans TaxID=1383851 RepID=A0A256IFC7_9EURY|nr:hypothetical protein [Halorubrum halodurans]OYR55249.1 hypothetical protein DJ70_12470 [Halorubrum halodurans]
MSDSRVAKATIRDTDLLASLEEAEEEHGSLADAVRHAVATTYAGDDDTGEVHEESGLPVKAREGHRKLVEWTGIGGRIELGTAESILANHLNIQKGAVRKVVIKPLKREEVIALHQGVHHVSIVVGSLQDGPIDADTTSEPETTTSGEAVADGGSVRERLDELANAEVER